MADLMSLYGDLHAVRANDPTLRGVDQAQILGLLEEAMLKQARAQEYRSRPMLSGATGGFATANRNYRARQNEDEALSTLKDAFAKQQGVDQYTAQLQAIQQQIAEEEAIARKTQAAQGAGWGPASDAVALGMKAPPVAKPQSGVMAEIPDGRGGVKKVLLDPTTGQPMQDFGSMPPPAGEADPTTYKSFGEEVDQRNKLRQYYQKDVQKWRNVTTDIQKLNTSLDKATGAGDIAAIYSLIRGLDPESVVREGEVALLQAANSIIGRLQLRGERMKENRALSDSMRGEIRSLMTDLKNISDQSFKSVFQEATERATADELDPAKVFSPSLMELVNGSQSDAALVSKYLE